MNNNNLVGKLFEDTTGKIVSINDVDGNIAHLDSGQRIAVERLLDASYYTESINPDLFTDNNNNNNNSYYSALGDQIRNMNSDIASAVDSGVQVSGINSVVESHSDAQRSLNGEYSPSHSEYDDIESRRAEMARNANDISNNIGSSNLKLREISGESEESEIPFNRNLDGVTLDGSDKQIKSRETSVVMLDENNDKVDSYSQNVPNPKNDPIYAMFSQVKRATNFSLNVKLVEKIPRKDFLKMWEESYEVSIIDYLVDEFTEKLIKDPTMIKDQLRDALSLHIYGKPKAVTKTKTVRKSRAKSTTQK